MVVEKLKLRVESHKGEELELHLRALVIGENLSVECARSLHNRVLVPLLIIEEET